MKIFITGAAKSGTTLLARLMHSFGMPIATEETSLIGLTESKHKKVVCKRSEYSIFSNILKAQELEAQKQLIRTNHIRVINIYRNGVDVLESFERDWGYWNPLIWCESIRQMHVYSSLITVNVKYEDLVRHPDMVQNYIGGSLGLTPDYKFSQYTEKTPKSLFPTNQDRYKIRPISDSRTGKQFDVRKPGIDIDYFNRQMESLGYERI